MDRQNLSSAISERKPTVSGPWVEHLLLGLKVSLSVVMAAITLATVLSNSFVIIAICLGRNLRSPANYLIGSLAFTDLLVALLVMPISNAYITLRTWSLGQVMCDIWVTLDVTLCTASIMHLCAIALDRYWAVTQALRYTRQQTPVRAGLLIGLAWGISLCISFPPLFWTTSRAREDLGECTVDDHVFYSIYATCGTFYIPSAVLVILYAKIYLAARSRIHRAPSTVSGLSAAAAAAAVQPSKPPPLSQCSVSSNSQDTNSHSVKQPTAAGDFLLKKRISMAHERKAIKTLGLILGAFILCWLPFFTTVLVLDICGDLACWSHLILVDFFIWLGYLNSLINPVIYTFFNKSFKQAFHRLVYSKRCWR